MNLGGDAPKAENLIHLHAGSTISVFVKKPHDLSKQQSIQDFLTIQLGKYSACMLVVLPTISTTFSQDNGFMYSQMLCY